MKAVTFQDIVLLSQQSFLFGSPLRNASRQAGPVEGRTRGFERFARGTHGEEKARSRGGGETTTNTDAPKIGSDATEEAGEQMMKLCAVVMLWCDPYDQGPIFGNPKSTRLLFWYMWKTRGNLATVFLLCFSADSLANALPTQWLMTSLILYRSAARFEFVRSSWRPSQLFIIAVIGQDFRCSCVRLSSS